MSHEFVHDQTKLDNQPSQAVKDEAAKIIAKLDGLPGSPWYIDCPEYDGARAIQAREMLIKDSQTFSPQDMKDLLKAVIAGEDHKRGYDLALYGHSSDQIRAQQQKLDQERQDIVCVLATGSQAEKAAVLKKYDQENTFGPLLTDNSKEARIAAFAKFNREQERTMADFKKQLVIELTHYKTPDENGEKGRAPGNTITVAAYRMVDGLPDFKIVGS